MSDQIIVAENVKKGFHTPGGRIEVLRGVNLELRRGDRVGIFGPSGSGKTTLLYIIGTLDHPDSGRVLIEGNDISRQDDRELSFIRRKKIGFVFQFFNLIPEMTVLENVALPLILLGEKPKIAKEKTLEILNKLGLYKRALHFPDELSGGEQQRVAIARAVVKEPSIILADEPTGNLDRENALKIMELFTSLTVERNLTLLMVSHNTQLKGFFEKTYILENGILKNAQSLR